MKFYLQKLKQSTISVLPIVCIVYLLSLTPLFDMTMKEKIVFILSSFFLIQGMTAFEIGAELSMTPMGDYVGTGVLKTKKLSFVLAVAFIMGILVTIAEPDLIVLSEQVKEVIDSSTFVISIGIGVGIFLVIALLKVIYNRQLATLILLFYMLLFALSALLIDLDKWVLLPLVFDSGGVTTGPITVPFIMAFGVGIAATLGGRNSNDNSFGFVALCSIGPILIVLLSFISGSGSVEYTLPNYSIDYILSNGILTTLVHESLGVARALGLVFAFFMILNELIMKLPIKKMLQIIVGLLITFIGLVIFLTSASIGFLPIGFSLGLGLVRANRILTIGVCFLIGMTVVLAEPAIYVLTTQVEEVTGRTVSRKSMLMALSIGVGFAIAFSMYKIYYKVSILNFLIPGYFISLALSLFVPPIYTAIAFDSGGVASGPLTSTFILPLMVGACTEILGVDSVMEFAFGVVALVAMTPLITIQFLGFKAIFAKIIRDRISMKRILNADDNQIVYFEV